MDKVINIRVAGLGGQGVVKASDILAETAFRFGVDVKKSELHGLSQRGGSVYSDVRFGPRVFSPLVSRGEVDFLVVLALDQVDNNLPALHPNGTLIRPNLVDEAALPNKKALNVALLGALSVHLSIPEATWLAAIRASFPEKFYADNETAFRMGQQAAKK